MIDEQTLCQPKKNLFLLKLIVLQTLLQLKTIIYFT